MSAIWRLFRRVLSSIVRWRRLDVATVRFAYERTKLEMTATYDYLERHGDGPDLACPVVAVAHAVGARWCRTTLTAAGVLGLDYGYAIGFAAGWSAAIPQALADCARIDRASAELWRGHADGRAARAALLLAGPGPEGSP